MVLPSVPPISTVKRLSAWNCFRFCGAPKRGMPSMSPASSAATCAAGSLMKRKVTFFIFTAAALRYASFFTSVIDEPFFQSSKRERAGADRLGRRGRRALRVEDDRGVLAHAEQEVAVGVVEHQDHGVRVGRVDAADVVEHRLLRLVGRAFGLGALEAELHVAGVEGLAVVELHAAAQLEGVDACRPGRRVQLSASSGVTVPSMSILVSPSSTL